MGIEAKIFWVRVARTGGQDEKKGAAFIFLKILKSTEDFQEYNMVYD